MKRFYTKSEDAVIRQSSAPIFDIAIQLGRSYMSVYGRMRWLMSAGISVKPKERKEYKNKGIKKKLS